MSYTKLDSGIIHSSIWSEENYVRILWITLLAMSEFDGTVRASIPGLANASRITVPECEKGLKKLLSEDPYSRTKDNNGRRIKEIDGGWIILNHARYREESNNRKAYMKDYMADYRKKIKGDVNLTVNNRKQALAHTDTDTIKKESPFEAQLKDYWNCKDKLPKIRSFTKKRLIHLKQRLSESLFVENWKTCIDKLAESKFCTGYNDRGWRADIDFLLGNDTNYVKILENKYDNGISLQEKERTEKRRKAMEYAAK